MADAIRTVLARNASIARAARAREASANVRTVIYSNVRQGGIIARH